MNPNKLRFYSEELPPLNHGWDVHSAPTEQDGRCRVCHFGVRRGGWPQRIPPRGNGDVVRLPPHHRRSGPRGRSSSGPHQPGSTPHSQMVPARFQGHPTGVHPTLPAGCGTFPGASPPKNRLFKGIHQESSCASSPKPIARPPARCPPPTGGFSPGPPDSPSPDVKKFARAFTTTKKFATPNRPKL